MDKLYNFVPSDLSEKELDEKNYEMNHFLSILRAIIGDDDSQFDDYDSFLDNAIKSKNNAKWKEALNTNFVQLTNDKNVDAYLLKNGRRGVKINNNYDNPNTLLQMALQIKKLNNIVTTLTGIAQNLASDEYSGATHHLI